MHSSSDTVTSFFGALEGEKTNSVAAQGGLPPVLKKACLHFAQFCESGLATHKEERQRIRQAEVSCIGSVGRTAGRADGQDVCEVEQPIFPARE